MCKGLKPKEGMKVLDGGDDRLAKIYFGIVADVEAAAEAFYGGVAAYEGIVEDYLV